MDNNPHVPFSEITDLDLWSSLGSTVCPACGQDKKRKHTLCGSDYYKLPKPKRDALYNPLGHGYREAVIEALKHLQRLTFWAPL